MDAAQALKEYAEKAVRDLREGQPLDPLTRALIRLGLAASVTALDRQAMAHAIEAAFDVGANVDQVEEIIALVSGLGVHTLMLSQTLVLEAASARGLIDRSAPLDEMRQKLWDDKVGDDPFWTGFERENPGFLDAMLRLNPTLFHAFFDYCAVPWQIGSVRALTKELTAVACDLCPTHIFGPGFRVHLANAISLGAGRRQIIETLELASHAPGHAGVR